ncbi:hypothetical protein C8J57DRAFT_1473077 [Mycena rebaudengoi]|nr:hypothetical protein C8J57DRAFT_1473077 [Mycena rebaudengoi]
MASIIGTSQDPPAPPVPPQLPSLPTKGNAVWTKDDTVALLDYLVLKKAQGEQGGFKTVTFNGAATVVEPLRTRGGPKTSKSCSQKYAALKKLWNIVHHIKGVSGWSWSDTKGVNVTPASQGTWEAYVKKYPAAERFQDKGWPYYDLIAQLVPSKAKGANAFRAATAAPAIPAVRAPSPDWNEDEMDRDCGGNTGDAGSVGGDAAANNDDDDKSSSPAPSGVGRRAAQSTPTYHKKSKLSGGARALEMIASSAMDFNDMMGTYFASTGGAPTTSSTPTTMSPLAFQTSPKRRTDAIMQAQKELWLTASHRVALVKILRDVTTADVYNALLTDEIRIPWVLEELNDVGIIAFHPLYSNLDLGLLV